MEEKRTKTFVSLAEIPSAPNQWAAMACNPSWTARIPLRQTNSQNHNPIAPRYKKSCMEGTGGKGIFHNQPNQSQSKEPDSKVNQDRHKTRQAGRFLMLCLFSTLELINILLIGERVLKDTPGWGTIGVAAILGWLISMSANLEESDAKQATITTLVISLIALAFGVACTIREARGIGEPFLLVVVVAAGTIATAVRNYLDVASVTRQG